MSALIVHCSFHPSPTLARVVSIIYLVILSIFIQPHPWSSGYLVGKRTSGSLNLIKLNLIRTLSWLMVPTMVSLGHCTTTRYKCSELNTLQASAQIADKLKLQSDFQWRLLPTEGSNLLKSEYLGILVCHN